MKYIITGGTGLIGSALSRALLAENDQVFALSRSPERARVPDGVTVLPWDGRSADGWWEQAEGADGIVNLAGESIGAALWSQAQKQRILSSRQNAGAAVVDAVRRVNRKPAVVVQISGVGYYGIHGDQMITENDPPGQDFLAKVAIEWENATRPVEDMGVRRVVLRSGVVLEKDSGVLPRMMLPFNLFVGGPLGTGRQWVSWIHLADQVRGLVFALKNQSARGVYNLTSPEPVTNADFGKALGRVMRRPYWIPAPGFALKLALGEMSTLVLDGQRVIPQRIQAEGFEFRYPHLPIALTDLLASV
ncbi:MAG TPA: TIGR01777 family oxidoreductase [Anaerolinea sp.]|nr:TIGR01777 family oxidoreductase [Anaerolinea sp.]